MSNKLTPGFSRRSALASSLTAVAILAGVRSGSAQGATPAASPMAGEWTFTDDKNVTVTLPTRPTRIAMDVNAAASLWDFGIRPTSIFGWNVMADGTLNAAAGEVVLDDSIEVVGNVNEPINVEQLIASEPELIITITTSLTNDPADYWSIDVALQDQVKSVAPLIAISTTGLANEEKPSDAGKITERFAVLAGLLGADLESAELAADKQEFEDAKSFFEVTTGDRSDIVAMFIAPGEDTHWIAWAPAWSDLSLYDELGMNILDPETHEGWWEQISLEQVLKYPSDMLFVSTRGALTIDDIKADPVFGTHPAVKAGQVYDWNQDTIHSYRYLAVELNAMSASLSDAEKVT